MPIFRENQATKTITSEDGQNVVTIRAHLNLQQFASFQADLMTLSHANVNDHLTRTQWIACLLPHYIVAWEGPEFRTERGHPVPLSPENIYRMDWRDPFVEQIGQAVWATHFPPEDEDTEDDDDVSEDTQKKPTRPTKRSSKSTKKKSEATATA